MKKRIVSALSAVLLTAALIMSTGVGVEASVHDPILDGSYLTRESESTGTATKITRGEDLQIGYSKILKAGAGAIYAGGTTIAQHTVESVKVLVRVEKALNEEDDWHYVTHWVAENNNADSVNTSKRIEVEGGYYYRVVCVHSAGEDISDSLTNGIFIE